MTRMIFVNLPVVDLPRSVAFYEGLGFTSNPHFSDETAACMVWSETIYVMVLTHAKWATFTNRPIPPIGHSEVLLAIAMDCRAEVDALHDAAVAHGGEGDVNPAQDLGFMYARDFADPDGHVWNPFWMDPAAVPPTS
jgi:uncharacterized protein